MNERETNNEQQRPIGELFTRLYVERGAPTQDSAVFRTRIEAYLERHHFEDYDDLAKYLKEEAGLQVSGTFKITTKSVYYDFPTFFGKAPIENVLSATTLIWRRLAAKHKSVVVRKGMIIEELTPVAAAWLAFVHRVMHEENMAFTVDEKCGVHFVVDEEFERNRVSALRCLETTRYSGARAALQASHSYLDSQPADTKASVRSAFEALEIVARLIDTESKNLNKFMVEKKLKPLAQSLAKDQVEKKTVSSLFDGIALFVDGLHNYRHGQGIEQPIAPSESTAVYVLSSVAATLRWLVLIDSSNLSPNP